MNEDMNSARLLLEHGANLPFRGGFTHGYHDPLTMLPPLHYAATVGSAGMVRLLLSQSPGIVESRDERGQRCFWLVGLGIKKQYVFSSSLV